MTKGVLTTKWKSVWMDGLRVANFV